MATPAARIPDVARFTGFADTDRRFFRALARNQNREWFQQHKREYDDGWLHPMQSLLGELRERIDGAFPQQPLSAPKVFRIYRDVRFSKDKSPYKTHVGGYIGLEGGEAGPSAPSPLYLHLGDTEAFACAGHYMMTPPQLARFREAVADDTRGAALATLLKGLTRAGYGIGAHETMARVPRGMDPAHPRADLLRQKGLIVSFPELPPSLLVERGLVTWLTKHVKRVAPVVEWLAAIQE
jgi:uncharacterized protein (TIGR02453 family)